MLIYDDITTTTTTITTTFTTTTTTTITTTTTTTAIAIRLYCIYMSINWMWRLYHAEAQSEQWEGYRDWITSWYIPEGRGKWRSPTCSSSRTPPTASPWARKRSPSLCRPRRNGKWGNPEKCASVNICEGLSKGRGGREVGGRGRRWGKRKRKWRKRKWRKEEEIISILYCSLPLFP